MPGLLNHQEKSHGLGSENTKDSSATLFWALGSAIAAVLGLLVFGAFFWLSPILAAVALLVFWRQRSRRGQRSVVGAIIAVMMLAGSSFFIGTLFHLLATVTADPAWRR